MDNTMAKQAFLFVYEGAVYPIDADELEVGPPRGEYGEGWVVVRADTAKEALAGGKCALWEGLRDDVMRARQECSLRYAHGPPVILLGRRSWLQLCIALDDYGESKQYRGALLICDPTHEDLVRALPPAHLALDSDAPTPIVTRGNQ